MIKLRPANQRRHDQRSRGECWHTFYPTGETDPLGDGFGALGFFSECRLPPGAVIPRHVSPANLEVVTYVCGGAIAYEDSMGRSGVVQAGEFQRMTVGLGIHYSEANASRTDWAHIFQISLRGSEVGVESGREQKRFSAAERRGELRVIASPDARRKSLRIHPDAVIYSALLDNGQHVVHEIVSGRAAWIHIVQGEVTLGDLVLTTGDSAGVMTRRSLSVTASAVSEILVVDLVEPPMTPSSLRSPANTGD
ncbi:MAG TPA: pirin family protein [Polyangiaceae bacterium]|nr:pirin family protein [Polyangiaceae bacterium]